LTFRYNYKTKFVQIYCPLCKAEVSFTIPDTAVQDDTKHFPVPFQYIHGDPAHNLTLYLDKQFKIRGKDFGETVKLSPNIISRLQSEQEACMESETEVFLKVVINVLFQQFQSEIPDSDHILHRWGEKIGYMMAPLFLNEELDSFLIELVEFWGRIGFGKITVQNRSATEIILFISDSIESKDNSGLHLTIAKMYQGLLETLFRQKLDIYVRIQDISSKEGTEDVCAFRIFGF
jgi:predicted hydrocarbon binding protein